MAFGLGLLLSMSASCAAVGISEAGQSGNSVESPAIAGIPAPPSLDTQLTDDGRERGSSFLNRTILAGNDFMLGTIDHGPQDHVDLLSQGGAESQWLIYGLPVQGVLPEFVNLTWLGFDIPENDAGFELLMADFGAARWRWLATAPEADGALALPQGDWLSPLGNTYLAVLCHGGQAARIEAVTCWTDSEHSVPQPDDSAALHVGPAHQYPDIESAYAAATDNTTIIVHPAAGAAPYLSPALQVYKAGISFVADNSTLPAGERIQLRGGAYNYTGAGSVPRAIFQFNPGADACLVQGFELYDVHNDSHNGAGVRINQANDVSIVDCEIHGCDMGIMSNGSAAEETGARQLILSCLIRDNGSLDEPGYNHNLYLGGHSATLRHCEISGALTGHNVKSRAHINRLEYCYIHDSANREIDFVDADDTELPGSDSMLLGCIVVKQANMSGNKHTIHFGRDGGSDHNGTLFLTHCTIVSPYLSPYVQLTAPSAGLRCVNSLFWSTENPASGQTLVSVANGASLDSVSGEHNWFSAGISIPSPGMDPLTNLHGSAGLHPPFADPAAHDFHLGAVFSGITDAGKPLDWQQDLQFSGDFRNLPHLLDEYRPQACGNVRVIVGEPDLGAYEYQP